MNRFPYTLVFISMALVGCKLTQVNSNLPASELEGMWQSDCVIGLKAVRTFNADAYTFELVSHTDLVCSKEKSRQTFESGKFSIGAALATPAGSKELNLVTSFAGHKNIYTIFKHDGASLNFTTKGTAPKDGSSAAARINVLAASAMKKI